MKKIYVLGFVVLLVLGFALSAAAVTINDPANGELNLYQIFADPLFNGGNFANSQAIANTVPIVETLPAGLTDITVSAYAKFAAFSQNPGVYPAGNPGILQLQYFSPDFTTAFPANGANGIFSINDWPSGVTSFVQFGFFDDTSGGGIKYTELSANNGGALGQSNGLIFKISDTHYIVAFEDGGGVNGLGDRDYNDLVFNVNTSGVPIPPSVFLMGSGLLGLGLIGWRRKQG
jgi:hypothetical protein